jgi:ADP-ribosyl-[dinitrogen reductase] hydrolase
LRDTTERLAGVLLGTAVGDALGLPREALSPRRAERLFGPPPLRHRLLFGRGIPSDDTDHTCFVAEALLASPDDPGAFARHLARALRLWLVTLPAGVGFGTLRALLKLWVGVPPSRAGVRSAGNGPAMRSAVIGAFFAGDLERTRSFVRASTLVTHTDPRAEEGALVVALAAGYAASRDTAGVAATHVLEHVGRHVSGQELLRALDAVAAHVEGGSSAREFADALGLRGGVTGYVNHTVPAALFCWLRYGDDYRRVVEEAIALGGDADTTGAIAGAIAGAALGASAIPRDLLDGLIAWPRTVPRMRALAGALARRQGSSEAADYSCPPWSWQVSRSTLLLVAVLAHGLRRTLPPY